MSYWIKVITVVVRKLSGLRCVKLARYYGSTYGLIGVFWLKLRQQEKYFWPFVVGKL